MTYGKYSSYGLPDKIIFTFNTKEYKLPKGITFDFDDGEYRYFYAQMADRYARLAQITLNTQNKMRTVIYKMAREAAILNQHKQITGLFLSTDFIDTLSHHDELLYFPTRV
jgi:hypothetical protein